MAENLSQLLFPLDVLKWMKLNAKPRMSFKLMQCYKYFQHTKFPYFVVHNFYSNGEMFCYQQTNTLDFEELDIEDSLICISNELEMIFKDNIPFLIPKIVYCELRILRLQQQNIFIKDLNFLCSAGKINEFFMSYTVITGYDGNLASMDNILECLPNVAYICFNQHHPSIISVEYASKIISPKLKDFELWNVNINTFNLETFLSFMEKHYNIIFQMSIVRQEAEPAIFKDIEKRIAILQKLWPVESPRPYFEFCDENRSFNFDENEII